MRSRERQSECLRRCVEKREREERDRDNYHRKVTKRERKKHENKRSRAIEGLFTLVKNKNTYEVGSKKG